MKKFFNEINLKGFDIVAILIVLLGICQGLFVVGLMVAADIAKLISSSWANSKPHWLAIIFGLAVIWITMRWKKLNC